MSGFVNTYRIVCKNLSGCSRYWSSLFLSLVAFVLISDIDINGSVFGQISISFIFFIMTVSGIRFSKIYVNSSYEDLTSEYIVSSIIMHKSVINFFNFPKL